MADDSLDRTPLPDAVDVRHLRRRALQIVAILVFVGLVVALAPGIGDLRDELARASLGWLAVGVAFEIGSCLSYAVMFRPIFCPRMPGRLSTRLALSEVGVGALVPAAGTAGLALGAWALRRVGMSAEKIATRSVAFFIIKSSVNFVVALVLGVLLAVGVLGPALDLELTVVPAALALIVIVVVATMPLIITHTTLGEASEDAPRARRWVAAAARALDHGVREAGGILRRLDPRALGGSFGYYAFDNAVLWATFMAISGTAPALAVIVMAYLLGQMGGLLPLPGGLGGVDGGLIGMLVVYGTPLATATAAVLLYRVIYFWVPIVIGSFAFAGLRPELDRLEEQRA